MSRNLCKVISYGARCGDPVSRHGRGFCTKHYHRNYRTGSPYGALSNYDDDLGLFEDEDPKTVVTSPPADCAVCGEDLWAHRIGAHGS